MYMAVPAAPTPATACLPNCDTKYRSISMYRVFTIRPAPMNIAMPTRCRQIAP